EPERWQAMKKAATENPATHRLGSIAELFGDARWRKRAIIGLLLSSSGIIGLWAIGFFSFDLTRSVFRKTFEAEARAQGEAKKDLDFMRLVLDDLESSGGKSDAVQVVFKKLQPSDLLNLEPKSKDVQVVFKAILALRKEQKAFSRAALLAEIDKLEHGADNPRSEASGHVGPLLAAHAPAQPSVVEHVARISKRTKEISGRLTLWAGITSIMFNLGAAFGIYAFTRITAFSGRRPAFAVSYVLAMLSTAWVFWFLDSLSDVFWMVPIMGFCQLALFGGYAIYFPELFPTRLRSTGTSFCYNGARFIAALGPTALGLLTRRVFSGYAEPQPLRYAGVTMCAGFLIGLLVLPFAPETRGQPLPETD